MRPISNLPRPFPKSYWVVPGNLLAGEYPGSLVEDQAIAKIKNLFAVGIDFFLDLTREGELTSYEQQLKAAAGASNFQYQYIRFEIVDFSIPKTAHMRLILDMLDEALLQGRHVYLHCWGGVGRTGTVVGCYFVRHGMSSDQALQKIAQLRQVIPLELRRMSPESPEQYAMVRGWQQGN